MKNNTGIKIDKQYAVTGTFHGSIVYAISEGEARRLFHNYYNGESITHVKCYTLIETLQILDMM
jgi:hypothetical protein